MGIPVGAALSFKMQIFRTVQLLLFLGWNGSDPCVEFWTGGVACSASSATDIKTQGLNLTGYLGSLPHNLQILKQLDVSSNNIVGEIPYGLPPNATHINMACNHLIPIVPISLTTMKKLRHMDLSYNNFTGDLSSSFGSLSNLSRFKIQGLNLTEYLGSLPHNLQILKQLDVSSNNIVGEIPYGLPPNATNINMACNHLIPIVPISLSTMKKLRHMGLSYNNFTGDLSSSFGSLSNLSRLIEGNKFYQLGNSPPTTQANADENFVPNKVRKHKKNPMGRGGIAFMVGGGALLATGFTIFMAIYLNKLQRLRSFQGNHNSLLSHHVTAAEEVSSTALNENLEIQPFNATLDIALHSAAYKPLLGGLQLRISSGVAQVLNYLNSTFSSAVAHCNLKAANILLDEILKPRVCDIGLAILKPNKLKFRGSKIAITDTWHTSPGDDDQGFYRSTNNAESSGTATPKKKALLLGMDYPDVEDISLQHCGMECLSLREILMQNFDFAGEDVKILCDSKEDYVEPTIDEISRQLEWLLQGAGNVLFLYIAGHAFTAGDSNKPAIVTSPDYNIMTKKFCSDIIEGVPLGATLTVVVNTCLGGYFFKEAKRSSKRRGEVIVYTVCDEFGGIKDGDFYFGVMERILQQQETKEITNKQLYERFKAAMEGGVKLYDWEVSVFYKGLQFYCSNVKIGARFLGF